MRPRVFVTGSQGFVGRHFLKRLLGRDLEITCLVRRETGDAGDGVRVVRGDLRQPDAWARELEGVDTVVHVAGVTGTASAVEHAAVNDEATAALVQRSAAAGVRRFVLVSTIAVKFTDKSRYPYARAKERGEAAVRASGEGWVIVRPAIVLGPGSPVLAGLRRLARLPWIPLFGGGQARVQPVHVLDLAELLAGVVEDGSLRGEVLEAGGPDVLTVRDLLMHLRGRAGGVPRTLALPEGPISAVLWRLERAGLRLPLTAGQLATFVEDGVAEPHPWIAARSLLRTPLAEMLE